LQLRKAELLEGDSGVRARAMRSDGTLVEDLEYVVLDRAVHVLNAPSPTATASLAIGEEIAELGLAQ
jgi:L-2-hydroxyglutarate oxidase LhgO